MRIDALDDLAVEFQHQAQHAMRRRVLRPEVDVEVADALLARLDVLRHARPDASAQPAGRSAARNWVAAITQTSRLPVSGFFSSPGRMYSAPSQGDMKSKARYSCTSVTGS